MRVFGLQRHSHVAQFPFLPDNVDAKQNLRADAGFRIERLGELEKLAPLPNADDIE